MFSTIQSRERGELVAARLRAQPFYELRLPSLSLWRSDDARARLLAAAAPWSRRMMWRRNSIRW